MRITCAGGGPAGLYFAVLAKLANPAHEITVLERNPAGVTYGWGVVFWDDLLDDLYRCDPVSARMIWDAACKWDEYEVRVSGKPTTYLGGYGFSMGRRGLLEILARRATDLGVDVRYEVDPTDESQFAGADLVIAGDGARAGSGSGTPSTSAPTSTPAGTSTSGWARRTSSTRSRSVSSAPRPAGSGSTRTRSPRTPARSSWSARPRPGRRWGWTASTRVRAAPASRTSSPSTSTGSRWSTIARPSAAPAGSTSGGSPTSGGISATRAHGRRRTHHPLRDRLGNEAGDAGRHRVVRGARHR